MRWFAPHLSVACVVAAFAVAQSDTGFTYQGSLMEGGGAAQGPYDMAFALWDAPTNGSQLGSTIALEDVGVDGGLFTVELDFGVQDTSGAWLEVTVEGFTLDPRIRVTASPFSLQTRGIFVDGDDNVGIGTTVPLDELHVAGDNATLRLEDTTTPGGYTTIEDPQPTQLRINKHNDAGLVLMDLNPEPDDGVSLALVRFFRQTATTGIKAAQFLRGNGTTQASAQIGVDGADSWFQAHGGNLGIGTASPRSSLEVVGDGSFHGPLGVGDPSSRFGQLTVVDSGDGAVFAIDAEWGSNAFPTIFASNAGSGGSIWAVGDSDVEPEGGGVIVAGDPNGHNIGIDNNEIMARNAGNPAMLFLNADGGDVLMGAYQIRPAFAYARIRADGSILSSSANVLGTRTDNNFRYIQFAEPLQSTDIIIATDAHTNSQAFVIAAEPVGGELRVTAYGISDGFGHTDLSFIVFRP